MRCLPLLFAILLTGCAHLGWVLPVRDGDCPSTHRVKGNADSGYYHQPGDPYYLKVKAERCFKSTKDAEQAGFRPAGGLRLRARSERGLSSSGRALALQAGGDGFESRRLHHFLNIPLIPLHG